jgi:hypothetical protein
LWQFNELLTFGTIEESSLLHTRPDLVDEIFALSRLKDNVTGQVDAKRYVAMQDKPSSDHLLLFLLLNKGI